MNLYAAHLLEPAECQALIRVFELRAHESKEQDFSGQPVLRWPQFEEAGEYVCKCWAAAENYTGHRIETTILTRMGPGGWHEQHAANCRRDEAGKWVPNHTPQRTHTAIVYLNDGFDGGELYFPQQDIDVWPKAGQIVIFSSDGEHEHGVRRMLCGERYSLAMWLQAPA